MKDGGTRLLETGALGSAVAASICCIGPLALALLGMGGGALLLRTAPFRPYFLAASALLLGGAFYLTYRRPAAEACTPGSACALPSGRKRQKIVLWFVTGIVVLAATFPTWSKALL
jgi:mercuric ion transport protein